MGAQIPDMTKGTPSSLIVSYRRSMNDRLWDVIHATGDWARRPRVRRGMKVTLAALLVAASVGAYFALRPRPKPDALTDDLDDVLDYTMLSDGFNKLPLNERLDLMKDIIKRMKGMSAGDSALAAAFAAGVAGKAREQLEKNMTKLMADVWDDYAARYRKVDKADRESFLDQAFLDMTKQMEDIAGVTNPKSDSQRLGEARTQAAKDEDQMRKSPGGASVNGDRAARTMQSLQQHFGPVTTPDQRGEMTKLMRDMTRRLRNEDIDTGKPKTDGAGAGNGAGGAAAPKPGAATPASPAAPAAAGPDAPKNG